MRPKSPDEIAAMREGGKMLATVLQRVSDTAQPGLTTQDLAEFAGKELKLLGGEPAFLGYRGFPSVICISVNDEVVHGIPGSRVLKAGDLVGLDFGVRYKGLITDAATSIIINNQASADVRKLLDTTKASLLAGIAEVRAGARIGDVSDAIEQVLRAQKLGVIEDLVGHGVGDSLHEAPEVPNFGKPGQGTELAAGMTIAIEPMATLGDKLVQLDEDGWTVKTRDQSLSAHFEHTVAVTDAGAQILTEA